MDFEGQTWDVAIIGAGMGGATLGHALAKAGHRVLFLERGNTEFTEEASALHDSEDPEERIRSGSWPFRMAGEVDGEPTRFFAPMGCGAGGSTLLYAAALERFEPCDFASTPEVEHPAGGWPISYEELRPYYEQVEKLFGVRGAADPLSREPAPSLLPPPAMAECDRHFFQSFSASGLHPYRMHVGCGYAPGCQECGGYVCTRRCKSDARTVCIEPALASGNAAILDRCEVERLEADATRVKEIVCRRDGERLAIRARIVVVSAGAYLSPALLLKSANEHWPDGLANSSDMVGRCLMFHVSDFIAIWPRGKFGMEGPRKTLFFRDFYVHDGERIGTVHSAGRTVEYGSILYFLRTQFDKSRWAWAKPVRQLLRIPAFLATKIFGSATVFATIVEDQPYPENRIVLDANEPNGMRFVYTVHDELRSRIRTLRELLRRRLSGHRMIVLGPEVNLNYGHVCGTCRFGDDPSSSVLDRNNKAHDVENLYVVDASFMPSSGAANPGLTIAANALRVAAHIGARLRGASASAA
jgi:choline dehydrogenase-like flavoprotein